MKTRRFLIWCSQLLLCATFYMSCEEKQQLPSVNEVRFSFESLVQQGSGEGRLKEIASPASVLVTIRNNRGQITEQKIDLYQFGGSYLSAPITLKTGEYALTKFLVIGQDQSVLAATPRAGSKYAPLVSDPLDIEFGVSLNTITTVTPEVIEVDKSSSPVDFGYGQFGFREVEMIQVVFSSFIKGASNFELTESHLKIEALKDSTAADTTAFWKYETGLEPKANVIPMKKASRYRITATKPGYKEWIKTISATNGDKVEIIFEQSSWGFKTVWNKNFGGSNMELVKKTIATKDGGVLIVGYTYSNDYDIDDLKGGSDAWALKLDAFGNIQWSKTYDMGYYDLVSSAAESGDGDGYLITGESYNENTLMGGATAEN